MTTSHWPKVAGIAYGGDYNPEQWDRDIWIEDMRLMREAGVNLVSIGVFSWALLEVEEGVFDFTWMDDLLDLLHANDIAVDLGTPSVVPPAWFFHNYPQARVTRIDGSIVGFGSRGMASHASSEYREAIERMATQLAKRYGSHPAVKMWHVHNEYGVPVAEDFGENSVRNWRTWLQERYGNLDALNEAWGTAFWGQHYGSWEHIDAPTLTASVPNPSKKLDWARYTDDQLRECFRIERDAIKRYCDQPVTTNFMAHQSWNTDLWKWAKEVDVVSDDHYLWSPDPMGHVGLSLSADLTRSVAGGAPWILMEHSTSAVNWQGRNIAKRPGEMRRNSMTHLARGADAILFFQWRASRAGAEKFHSAMLPHAGEESRVFREVIGLGQDLASLDEVKGSRVVANVAILYDWESLWAQSLEWRPSDAMEFRERIRTVYEALWHDGITVDFVHPEAKLDDYSLIVAPSSYLLTQKAADNLKHFVTGGGTLVACAFFGIADEYDRIHSGPFGSVSADILGLTVEEFLPLRDGENNMVAFGEQTLPNGPWAEEVRAHSAKVLGRFLGGPGDGKPAILRNQVGGGSAWYIGAHLGVQEMRSVLAPICEEAGVLPAVDPVPGVEVVVRQDTHSHFITAVNHNDHEVSLSLGGTDLLTGKTTEGSTKVEAGGVVIIRQSRSAHAQALHRSRDSNPI